MLELYMRLFEARSVNFEARGNGAWIGTVGLARHTGLCSFGLAAANASGHPGEPRRVAGGAKHRATGRRVRSLVGDGASRARPSRSA